MRQVILYPVEDGWWGASCPSLPGCHSQGTTRKEALENIKEANCILSRSKRTVTQFQMIYTVETLHATSPRP